MKKIICLLILFLISAISSKPEEDKVTNFPNYNYNKSDMYSGYLRVKELLGSKKLHYFLIESQGNPDKDPLVLWLNGGPGCSSLDGMTSEHGPRIFKEKSKEMYDNQYSWNKIANMIYLEAPAGVGFSKGTHEFLTDDVVASDNLKALLAFFEKFPEYESRDFYITGESYSGVYIPHLASKIIDHNNTPKVKTRINLKGVMIGNGLTAPDLDITNATVDFAYEHGLYGFEERQKFIQACGTKKPLPKNPACVAQVQQIMQIFQKINIYNVYGKCFVTKLSEEEKLGQIAAFKGFGKYPKTGFIHDAAQGFKNQSTADIHFEKQLRFLSDDNLDLTPPCADGVGSTWLFNLKEVQTALHVERTEWEICNILINTTYRRDPQGSFYLYPKLINSGLRVWKYSGDVDAAVPYNGTQQWINSLNLKVLDAYKPWSIDPEMIAGYTIKYNGLRFTTVKGAGHMVPADKPAEAYHLFESFLNDQDL